MGTVKFFGPDDLNQKTPQQVLKRVFFLQKDQTAKPVFVFGESAGWGMPSCVVSIEDCIVYYQKTMTVPKVTTLLYADIIRAIVEPDKKSEYAYVELLSGTKIKIDIKADREELNKLVDYINSYHEQGKQYIERRLRQDSAYGKKIELLRKGKNLDDIVLEGTFRDMRGAFRDMHEEFHQIDEAEQERVQKIDEKYTERAEKIEEKWQASHAKSQEKIFRISAARPHSYYTLQYCGGLNGIPSPCDAKITVNTLELFMEITLKNFPPVRIPLEDFRSASIVSEDTGISPSDKKTKFPCYLHIQCLLNGKDTEIVLSRQQHREEINDVIGQLQYAVNHFPERIQERQARDARYDARAEQLAAEREKLVAQMGTDAQRLRQDAYNITHEGEQPANRTAQPTNQSVLPAASSDDPIETVRKYKSLLDEGIITQEEFDAKKRELLNL